MSSGVYRKRPHWPVHDRNSAALVNLGPPPEPDPPSSGVAGPIHAYRVQTIHVQTGVYRHQVVPIPSLQVIRRAEFANSAVIEATTEDSVGAFVVNTDGGATIVVTADEATPAFVAQPQVTGTLAVTTDDAAATFIVDTSEPSVGVTGPVRIFRRARTTVRQGVFRYHYQTDFEFYAIPEATVSVGISAATEDAVGAFNANPVLAAAIATTADSATAAFVAEPRPTATVTATLDAATASFSATVGSQSDGTIAATADEAVAAFSAAPVPTAIIAAATADSTGNFNVTVGTSATATIGATLDTVVAAFASSPVPTASLAVTTDGATASFSAVLGSTATITATLGDDTAAFIVTPEVVISGPPRLPLQVFAERMYTAVDAHWTLTPITYADRPIDPATAAVMASGFARFSIVHGAGDLREIGDRAYRRHGRLFFQCFAPEGSGMVRAYEMVDHAIEFFRAPPRFQYGDVRLTDPRIDEIGADSGYYQVNVSAAFDYDSGGFGRVLLA